MASLGSAHQATLVVFLAYGLATSLTWPAQGAADEQATQKVLDEITVTARKQEVDLQEAPVAVSVVSGTDFERANIVKLDNLNGYVPGLMITKNDGAGRVVSIRGVGWETAQNLSTQPSILVYLDGVYLAIRGRSWALLCSNARQSCPGLR